VPLVRDETVVLRLQQLAALYQRPFPPNNLKQADFPVGATILANDLGTAPGFAVEVGTSQLFVMPGVPREMKHIFSERVIPRIAALARNDSHQLHFRTFGMGESPIGQALDGIEAAFPGVTIGYRASFPEVELKVHARAGSNAEARELAERAAAEVQRRMSTIIYGGRDDTFASAVGRTLREQQQTLALAESCTGGLVGAMLTAVPGSSDYLLFDAVVYSNAAKTRVLGVDEALLRAHGAVSEETAVAMVQGALRVSDASLAASITGIAGPGGGSDDKPVGTVWIGVGRREGPVLARRYLFRGDRERVRVISAYTALRLVQQLAEGRELS
jgi:nicotinamide-nucleotide amidase